MINIKNLTLSFGERKIFDGIDWFITDRSRIGLVGDNGTGKTTLLRAIAGDIEPDGGKIEIAADKTIGYLPQDLVELEDMPIMQYLKKRTGMAEIEKNLSDAEHRIAEAGEDSPSLSGLLSEHEKLQSLFEHRGGFAFEATANKVLRGLGFEPSDAGRSCDEFSGGWKMRIALASLLLSRPDILLLDEPTNHLDSESMEWLEGWLRDHRGAMIFVSHDRRFLDKMTEQIAELARCKLTLYSFGYEKYLVERERTRERLERQIEDQKERIEEIQRFVDRFRYKASKAAQVQSRIKQLEKMEIYEMDGPNKKINIRFPEAARSGWEVVSGRGLSKQYGEHVVFRDVDFEIHRGERVALVGVNGAGKSTLLRLLSETEKPTTGAVKLGHNVKRAYFSQESSQNLDYAHTVWEEAKRTGSTLLEAERRNLLGAFLFSGDDIHKAVRVLSGGEKSRLALFKLLLSDSNFLILDEPTNHLDMNTKELFQRALLQYNGTLLIVSHDRFFLDKLAERVVEIRDGAVYNYPGNYSRFIEKRADAPVVDPQTQATLDVVRDAKEQKRIEAEERNRLYQLKKVITDELDPLEKKIFSKESRRDEIDELLCAPDILADSQQIQRLMVERGEIEADVADCYKRWEELTERLEEVK